MSLSDILVIGVLVFAILLGAYFRFTGNNWDDFVRFHPDERYLTQIVAPKIGADHALCSVELHGAACVERLDRIDQCRAKYPDTNGRGDYFDTECSPFNPENVTLSQYLYGTLPLFIARIAADFWVDQTGDTTYNDGFGMQLVWRAVSAAADSLVILLAFFIGNRMHGKWVGALAALLYAAAVFPIQQAHFGTADAITNLFVMVTLWFAVRAMDTNSLWDYALFGVGVGAAVASRINVAPLAVIIGIPALVHLLPVFDTRVPWRQRDRVWVIPVAGVFVAAIVTFLTFRIAHPYAFPGPGFFGVFGFSDRFMDMLSQAQFQVSGQMDWAPNWQWVNRTGFLFPLQNMVIWGLGLPLGLLACISVGLAIWRLVRGRTDSLRNIVLLAWIVGYFLFVGNLWVMSMRYYLPLYGPLIILAAWVIVSAVKGAWAVRGGVPAKTAAAALALGVGGFTLLWAGMFTNIYRNMATYVQAGHYTWEQIPGDFYMPIDDVPETTPLINVALWNANRVEIETVANLPNGSDASLWPDIDRELFNNATRLKLDETITAYFYAPATGSVSTLNANRLVGMEFQSFADPDTNQPMVSMIYSGVPRVIQVEVSDDLGNTVGRASLTGAFRADDHPLGNSYTTQFDAPFTVDQGRLYSVDVTVIEGGPVLSTGAIMASELPWDEPVPPKVCYPLPDGLSLDDNPGMGLNSRDDCAALYAGTRFAGTPSPWEALVHVLNLDLAGEDTPEKRNRMLALLDRTDYLVINTNRRYDSQSRIPRRWPLTNAYYDALFNGDLGFELERMFQETFELGPLRVSDQYLPYYDGPEWLNELEPEEAFTVYDHPVVFIFKKRADYDPAQVALALDVPLDRSGLVTTYNSPIIAPVMAITSLQASLAPTHLMLSDEMREIQTTGGTWSDRFDINAIVNDSQPIAVAVWWAAIIVLGLSIWPILYVAFPGLADRGYGFAKIVSMMVIGWILWVLGTLRLAVWNRWGVIAVLITLVAISLFIVWRNRAEFGAFVRRRWRLLLAIETVTFVMYIAFIFVRISNPDLWHPSYGGEKPMDFAYFNAVLRSTVFPPIDPWFAGGYINYYYFGFVIVGVPTLLTGIIPSVAYNLIIPTLFGVTGVAAFSLAFSVANSWRQPKPDTIREPSEEKRPIGSPWLAGSMALLLAVVLGNLGTAQEFVEGMARHGGWTEPQGLVVDYYLQPKIDEHIQTFGTEPNDAQLSSYRQEARLDAAGVTLGERLNYEVGNTTSLVAGFVQGAGELLSGNPVQIAADRWFWGPTRTIAEIQEEARDGAINEMPYFTFLYGDLHAHMISMPLMLFAMAFVFHEVLVAGRSRRRWTSSVLALCLGAMTVGLFQAVNTWEYPTFLMLGVAGLAYAWWLAWKPEAGDLRPWLRIVAYAIGAALIVALIGAIWIIFDYVVAALQIQDFGDFATSLRLAIVPAILLVIAVVGAMLTIAIRSATRSNLMSLIWRVVGFVAIGYLAGLPFTWWFASGLTEFTVWEGNKTPLWAFINIHGLFLFLIVSLLCWETARWLSNVKVRALRGQLVWVGVFAFGLVAVIGVSAVVAMMTYQAALIVLPLIAWIAVLFFRPGQARAMQYVLVLAGLALAITMGTEIITLRFDNGRQNTIFKFYIQVWLLFSIVGGVGIAWILRDSARWRARLAIPWYAVFGILFFVAAMYPITATRGKAVFRMAQDVPATLDGNAYMAYANHVEEAYCGDGQIYSCLPQEVQYGTINMINDYNVIRWLNQNVEGSPVIMEGTAYRVLYKWGARISINTGLPAVIGWDYHQTQQRSVDPLDQLVRQRIANVNAFYSTSDEMAALDILDFYNVRYVIVTDYEKMRYEITGGLAKFDRWVDTGVFEIAFQEGEATIYEVMTDRLDAMQVAQFREDLSGFFYDETESE